MVLTMTCVQFFTYSEMEIEIVTRAFSPPQSVINSRVWKYAMLLRIYDQCNGAEHISCRKNLQK